MPLPLERTGGALPLALPPAAGVAGAGDAGEEEAAAAVAFSAMLQDRARTREAKNEKHTHTNKKEMRVSERKGNGELLFQRPKNEIGD
jgi:hypothetical protein